MIKEILIGIVIGVANIIPGVSGGTMAVTLGIYDKLIHAVTHILKEFKESIKMLIPILIGAVLGIGVLSFVIKFLFVQFPVQTNFLFIGLIIGGLPIIWNRLKSTNKKVSIGNLIAALAFFALVVGMAMIGEAEGGAADVSLNAVNMIKLFLVGMLASATMIIPGVSGSMVLMIIGYYNTIIDTITLFIKSALSMDMTGIMQGIGVLMPFGIGVLIGIGVIAKLIEIIFVKAPNYAYCAILGLIIASPIAIILMSDLSRYNIISVLTGIVTFAIGYFAARKLAE
ncbi:MAG: DUF368 domain-containing protein [Lachnospiraceae bacterium]|nr:DUF368 domain-containing protein [Lachnospiraceae bacterium]